MTGWCVGVDEFFSTACDLVEKTTRERRVEREKKKGMRVGEWKRVGGWNSDKGVRRSKWQRG